ncbi:unnamed protein product [Haemonchus placei]|uniref:PKD_channel domain-containing protein n=1 Tax=Haemonchus placei TaxID=6290 RepID=A0A0N4W8J8_HAEPC|nr:unnamed protein product [Haemonchus placei]
MENQQYVSLHHFTTCSHMVLLDVGVQKDTNQRYFVIFRVIGSEEPPRWDVAMTFRAYACTYMIVLAMYLNTLLSKHALSRMDTTSEDMDTFMKYDEQKTQDQDDFGSEETDTKNERIPGRVRNDRTLRSARMSIRLPRAPKGHHVEELDQMEKFLAEDDVSVAEK